MRIAKCITPLQLVLTGSKGSVAIGLGWEGDLDQVVGEQVIAARPDPEDATKTLPEKRVPVTIADMLGHHLSDDHFTVSAPPKKKGPAAAAATKE